MIPAPRWRVADPPDPALVTGLVRELGVPAPLAALLVQRGVDHADTARAFLRPSLDDRCDPSRLAGMADAVEEISGAIRRGDRILVHGDYDVDGQCAAAILTRTLRQCGGDAHAFLPHRIADGYDFGAAGLDEAARIGATCIVTCDCGITAVDAVAAARARGSRVVVTDHHLPGAMLPDAHAVVDPQRSDDRSGLTMLAGTGVVFKLIEALVVPLHLPRAWPHHLLDYVALATVADVVPLVGENRTLVKHGLRLLAQSRWPGLRALVDAAQLRGELRAGQVGFVLGPRLNAVGRIDDANLGLRLLLSDDDGEAVQLAEQLEACNRQRQVLDRAVLDAVLAEIESVYADADGHPVLVVSGEGWHPGVVGIVASRVVERYGRPAVVIALDGASGRGSGRSIDGFDLHAALTRCDDLLERYGGHRMAAGLTVHRDRIDALRARLGEVARGTLAPADLGPTQRVDVELSLDDVTDDLERWTRCLEPCGMGNPAAVFGVRRVRLEQARVVGAHHVRGVLAEGTARLDAIAFGWADRMPAGGAVDVAFRLERNEWNGASRLQARTLAVQDAA